MKIRYGFVSNSSSSSFVCDLTGEIYSGYDACLSDFGLSECKNSHIFPIKSILPTPIVNTSDEGSNYSYNGVPATRCPICSYKELSISDINNYMIKTLGGMAAIKAKIREQFKSYDEFKAWLSKKE